MSKAKDFNEFSTGCRCNMWQLQPALSDSLSKTFLNSTFAGRKLHTKNPSESTFHCRPFWISLHFPRFWLFCVTKMIQKMLRFPREHSLCNSTDVILLQRPEHDDFVQPDSKHDSAVDWTKNMESSFFSLQKVACQNICWGSNLLRNSGLKKLFISWSNWKWDAKWRAKNSMIMRCWGYDVHTVHSLSLLYDPLWNSWISP